MEIEIQLTVAPIAEKIFPPASVGAHGALTNLDFCESRNKVRLTADGKICPCPGNHGEVDLRTLLRAGADDAELAKLFHEVLAGKPQAHVFRENYVPGRPMIAIGG